MDKLRFEKASQAARYRDMWRQQRIRSRKRGIEFQLTFEQWLSIWKISRKLPLRGIQSGQYVMARHGDRGPYAVGNVKIITTNHNRKEAKQPIQIRSPESRGRSSLALRAISPLTEDQVSEIRRRYVFRSPEANTVTLAREYGVAQATIWFIVTNRSWKPLEAYQ